VTFTELVEAVGRGIEAFGVAAIVIGAVGATIVAGVRLLRGRADVYRGYREQLGRSILLGLELLVAADIIRTVAAPPSLIGVTVLAIIVAIRTFLSFSLQLEVTGKWPWQQRERSEHATSSP
jgi:uncharacterized membrane protein